jgi:thiol-disulfide isomerase/thioredoxin
MRRRDLLAGALAFAATPAAARPVMPLYESPREMLSPPFVDGEGRDLTLANFHGCVVLLNVWATWCAPCREEMPTLDALQARLGGDDFHVLPLSIDRAGLGPVRRFYDEIGIRHLEMYLAAHYATPARSRFLMANLLPKIGMSSSALRRRRSSSKPVLNHDFEQ